MHEANGGENTKAAGASCEWREISNDERAWRTAQVEELGKQKARSSFEAGLFV
jgi:hypothetical protein